jgi:predicted dehydrogenase/threonine dehydrogenase-like Zn-dependent dehydrogenase
MKQLLQNMANGSTAIKQAPIPGIDDNCLLISTTISLISAGTERMLVNFGKASYIDKARQQPEKVKMVLDKIKTDGLFSTIESVRSKLAQPIPLGYCNVGVVSEVGHNVSNFRPGERVISNGCHADVVKVSKNICARIPDNVDDETAAFTVLASIGLQGIRLAQPTLGETFVVIGVGLIGLLTLQLLQGSGCRVLAIDFDDAKLALAKEFGAEICNPARGEDPVAVGVAFSRGQGIDGVIITASTKSTDPVTQAARMSRKRGRIILVGVTGLDLNRDDFYEKELTFQVSCSYGPGRYDVNYEEIGLDYPIGFVRWTEQRNFEAILDMMAKGLINVKPLITHNYLFEDALDAYETLTNNPSALGILLQYTSDFSERNIQSVSLRAPQEFTIQKPVIGFIGAGNYASRILIPTFKKAGAQLHTVLTSEGINGVIHGEKAGFLCASTELDALLSNAQMNTIVIATRHDSHAKLVINALTANKNIFVEKPLALTHSELMDIEGAYHTANSSGNNLHLMVGFNRRFAPQSKKIKQLLETVKEPKSLIITINAGALPSDHWVQDKLIGGGRIIGEACHFIDLMRFFVGYEIISVHAIKMGNSPAIAITEDKAVITLGFADGSFGSIHYLANGSASYPKERVEIFTAGRVLQLDNFRKLKGYGWPGFKSMNLWKQNKGQKECVQNFLNALIKGTVSPIPFNEVIEVARVSIEAACLLRLQ